MRERLTLSFVLVTAVLLIGAFLARGYVVDGELRRLESSRLQQQADAAAAVLDQQAARGGAVDLDAVRGLVGDGVELDYQPADSTDSTDSSGAAVPDIDGALRVSALTSSGRLTLVQPDDHTRLIVWGQRQSLFVLLVAVLLLAGLAGLLVSRALASPFRRLATAADALGRGRLELDLPQTRIPEVQAVGVALRASAERLSQRLAREQEFSQHASHVLRTPLTGLRLELEDLAGRTDLPEDARGAARRCLAKVESIDEVAGELVAMSREESLVAGAEVPLEQLATEAAQRWADALDVQSRRLSAAAEGSLSIAYTPGPIEHVLELLLAAVLDHGAGDVRLAFHADDEGHLRIRAHSEESLGSAPPTVPAAASLVRALGGRLAGADPAEGFEVLLPRR